MRLSLKSVEMQVALPRTQDAGKLQEQMQKNHQHFQESLAAVRLKQEELKRKKTNQMENTKNLTIKREERKKEQNNNEQVSKNKKRRNQVKHPYLGKKIDLNG